LIDFYKHIIPSGLEMILDKDSVFCFVVWIGFEPSEIFLFFAFIDLLRINTYQLLSHQLINCNHENSLIAIIINAFIRTLYIESEGFKCL